jgi:PKD repeat protein
MVRQTFIFIAVLIGLVIIIGCVQAADTIGLQVHLLPKTSLVSRGNQQTITIEIVNTERTDRTLHVSISTDGIDKEKQVQLSWFGWIRTDVSVPGRGTIDLTDSITLPATVPPGMKAFKVVVKSTKGVLATETGFILIPRSEIIQSMRADPSRIFVSYQTVVTITAKINPVYESMPSNVILQRLGAKNEISGADEEEDEHIHNDQGPDKENHGITDLGLMYDDQTHGDVLAGDGIYTTQVSFNEPNQGKITLRISATFNEIQRPVYSRILTIDAMIPPSQRAMHQILATNEAAAGKFKDWSTVYGIDRARRMTIDLLRSTPGVRQVELSPDGYTINILYDSGLEASISTGEEGMLSTPGNSNSLVARYLDPAKCWVCTWINSELINEECMQSTLLGQSAFDLESVKSFSNYGVLNLNTHGGLCGILNNQVCILTGEEVSVPGLVQHFPDWYSEIAIPQTDSWTGDTYWAFTPGFITKYTSTFPNSLIVIDACHSLDGTSMANAFLSKGAAAYVGWTGTVAAIIDEKVEEDLFSNLAQGRTLQQSFNVLTATEKRDPSSGAVFDFRGDGNIQLPNSCVYQITPSAGPHGTISPPTPVTVQYAGSQTFTITPDSGYLIDQVLVNSENVDPTTSYTFTNVQADQTISATFKPAATPVPRPVADFKADPDLGYSPFTVQFTDLSTNNPTSWLWDFGDGETSTEQNPSHEFSGKDRYTITLTATNDGGSDTITKQGLIAVTYEGYDPIAAFSATPLSGEAPLIVQFTDESLNAMEGYTSWEWDFGDGRWTYYVQNPTHTYNYGGIYTVTLTVTNSYGLDDKTKIAYIQVTGNPPIPPVADFKADITTGKAPLTVTFTDLSTNDPYSWYWDFGDGGKSWDQNPSHTYSDGGTYTVSLTVTNEGGKDTMTREDYVSILPVADFVGTPLSGDAPLLVTFTDESTGNPTSWAWDFGDGQTSTDQNPTHTYENIGIFTVSLTATNTAGHTTQMKQNYISTSPCNLVLENGDFENAVLTPWVTFSERGQIVGDVGPPSPPPSCHGNLMAALYGQNPIDNPNIAIQGGMYQDLGGVCGVGNNIRLDCYAKWPFLVNGRWTMWMTATDDSGHSASVESDDFYPYNDCTAGSLTFPEPLRFTATHVRVGVRVKFYKYNPGGYLAHFDYFRVSKV